jgi:hypothetical protein
LDGCTSSEYNDAILTVIAELILRNIRIQSIVGDGLSSQLRLFRPISKFLRPSGPSGEAPVATTASL